MSAALREAAPGTAASPSAFAATAAAEADLARCRRLLAGGSRTFLAASHALPRTVRDRATALYAFCRVADDAIDEATEATRPAALAALRARLDGVYAGRVTTADPALAVVDRAFAHVVHACRLPRALPEALLDGFAWDAEARRYATLEDLHAYAARVAGTVGAMMACAMGVRDAAALARACDLGVAMQLTNIARDVGEDARAGRLYLPLAWLDEAGLDADAFLAAPAFDPRVRAVVVRLLAEADRLYARAASGIDCLPRGCRLAIDVAGRLYAAIGDAVAAAGHDSVSRRAVVGARAKLARASLALVSARPRAERDAAPLAATRFLVEAAAEATRPAAAAARAPRGVAARVVGVVELFERLEREDRHRAGARVALR